MFVPQKWKCEIRSPQTILSGMSPAQVAKGEIGGRDIYLKSVECQYSLTTYSVLREARIMKWLSGRLPVPKVIDYGQEQNREYVLMEAIPGIHIDTFHTNPETYIFHLAESVKQIQAVDISNCPFDSSLTMRLQELKYLLEHDMADVDPKNWETYHTFSSPQKLYDWLCQNRPPEDFAFSHGDLPANIRIEEGRVYFYDLGRAGIADRWQDIALCIRSIRDAYSDPAYERLFFRLLNLEPDDAKINYYILLDEMF